VLRSCPSCLLRGCGCVCLDPHRLSVGEDAVASSVGGVVDASVLWELLRCWGRLGVRHDLAATCCVGGSEHPNGEPQTGGQDRHDQVEAVGGLAGHVGYGAHFMSPRL